MTFFETSEGQALVAAVRKAGSVLLSYWPGGNATNDAVIHKKMDGSLVSTADLESNALLTTSLTSLFPTEIIFSEEVEESPEVIAAAPRVWIIDPLDGTSAFLEGRDDFSILVSRCEQHRSTVGILFLPARDIMALASGGGGATANGVPLRVSSHIACRKGAVYVRRFDSLQTDLASPMMDSGLALYKVAAGELDGALIRMKTHREWDIAAPIRLIEEAGGKVTDEYGQPIPLGVGEIAFGCLVASNGHVHQELLQLIPDSERGPAF
jgi:myo-inositol-1(or 4)-monophosphatase